MPIRRKPESIADVDRAAELYCQVVDCDNVYAVGGCQVTGRRIARKLRAARTGERRRVGRAALAEYRKQTGEVGAINWQAFHQWLVDHTPEITVLGIVLKVLTLLLLL